MAFVASQSLVLGAGVAVPLPIYPDLAANEWPIMPFSHMRVPGGTTYTFDSGQSWAVPASTDSVFAIPQAARYITATAASTAQVGKMD